ncbi:MAG: family 16 glycoside hydrolase, partial [Planctomycetota bacterium]
GAIVGGQDPPGSRLGAYLMTEETFGDFELEYEMRPDWRTDTGVLVRQHRAGTIGFQVLCDHRPGGGIGGFFTNGLGSYLAAPVIVDGDVGERFTVENLREGESTSNFPKAKLSNVATYQQFRKVWNVNGWNRFRVHCVGATPVLTAWVNDLEMGTLDSRDTGVPGYDPAIIEQRVGSRGHIGLEVHSNGPKKGWNQWAKGAVSRWRNIRVKRLDA